MVNKLNNFLDFVIFSATFDKATEQPIAFTSGERNRFAIVLPQDLLKESVFINVINTITLLLVPA